MDDMTPDELRRLHAATTQGVWGIEEEQRGFGTLTCDGKPILFTATLPDCPAPEHNHAFIVAAHNHLPDLLDRLERAEKALVEIVKFSRDEGIWRVEDMANEALEATNGK